MELPVVFPHFVVTNDVNNSGDGGRVVLHASPGFYRSLGHTSLAAQLEELGVIQSEHVFVFSRDADMASFPFLKAEVESVGFMLTVQPGEVVVPVPVEVPLLEPPAGTP